MFQERYMRRIIISVGVAAIMALLAYAHYAFVQTRYLTHSPVFISVVGEGEVFAKPDIAQFSFSVNAKEDDAATAQTKSADAVNAIMGFLKEKGVEEKDIKTSGYNLNPRLEYPQVTTSGGYYQPVEPKVVGYEVTQTIEVKVRKVSDIGMLISGVGERGATNVSGPSFTIDDDSILASEARAKAIADAKVKGEKLAKELGVRIVRMTNYWEEQGPYPMYGYGGMADGMKASSMESSVPAMPTGENTITSRINISYEVR